MKKYIFLLLPILLTQASWAQSIFQENGKHGIKNAEKVLVKAIYDQIQPYNEQQKHYPKEEIVFDYFLLSKNGKYQFVSKKDWVVFPQNSFEAIVEKPEGIGPNVCLAKEDDSFESFGLYSLEKKEWLIVPSYQNMGFLHIVASFKNDYLSAKNKNKFGIIDWEENVILDFKYEQILPTEVYYSVQVKENGKFTLYKFGDSDKPELKPHPSKLSYDSLGKVTYLSDYESQITQFMNDGKWGLLGAYSEKIDYPAIYDKITPIIDVVSGGEKLDYKDIGAPINGDFVALQIGDLIGLIEIDYPKDKEVFPIAYQAFDFTNLSGENTFILKKEGKWGLFIPSAMKLKEVSHTYADMKMLEGKTMILVQSDSGKFGLLGADGKELLAIEYDEITYKSSNSVTAKKDGKEEVKAFD